MRSKGDAQNAAMVRVVLIISPLSMRLRGRRCYEYGAAHARSAVPAALQCGGNVRAVDRQGGAASWASTRCEIRKINAPSADSPWGSGKGADRETQ